MVTRLEHCRDCTEDDCDLPDVEIYAGLELHYKDGDEATNEERKKYHDRDEAEEDIREDPLSVEVRQDWHTPGGGDNKPTEYTILLCTGGPAVRIIGDLDEHQQPETANLQYQDWFTPWERYEGTTPEVGKKGTTPEEEEKLLTYTQQFYFGE